MKRVGIIVAAGVALALAVVLSILGTGEAAGALTNWQALVLGAVQGFTELLPISSSGHLILVPWLFDWTYLEQNPDFNKTFDVALHLGTLVAVVVYFWPDLGRLGRAWSRSVRARAIRDADERVAWVVIVATIPAIAVGAAASGVIERHLGDPWQIAIFLAAGALLLWVVDRLPTDRSLGDLTFGRAILLGLAQTLALAPGVSRSGIVITAARYLRLDRDSAARISFYLLVPVVFGAAVYQGVKDVAVAGLPPGSAGPFVVGTLTAAVAGLAAIWLLLDYVRRHTYTVFVVYRLVIAALILLAIATGARSESF
ncbi:MAG TPA: undecaprenyl-diphosphate phosphatase [Gaiellaceae bacterium]|nr:undecaprenyl-diphosphate phosphatase [Gaiellaceae bacterium]